MLIVLQLLRTSGAPDIIIAVLTKAPIGAANLTTGFAIAFPTLSNYL